MKLFVLCLSIALASINSHAQVIRPQTDLGQAGNVYAAKRFAKYKQEGFVCAEAKAGLRRVVLSGFGPFMGSPENASGRIIGEFGGFIPPKGDFDVYGSTREITIGGVEYQICFLVTSVVWDISAAILISEIERFAPGFVLMTGLGSRRLLFETGNSNRATFAGGFDIEGNPVTNNQPQENYVLPPSDTTVPFISKLTWDTEAAQKAIDADVVRLGFETFIPEPGYESNNYICNNIAFATTHAVAGLQTELAGGMISLKPKISLAPKVGFMHYPSAVSTDTQSLRAWADILAKIVRVEL